MDRILIVEDDTDINNMMASALTKAGYECKQAFSGTEAMLYLNHAKYSVIILDLMLPGKSGTSIVEEIKPSIDTPIIVVSAKDELDTKVNLKLWVKVKKDWRDSDFLIKNFGYNKDEI